VKSNLHARGLLVDVRDHFAEQHGIEVVRRGHIEAAPGTGRIEATGTFGDALDLFKHDAHRIKQFGATLGWRHAAPRAHQQGVAGDVAQPFERGADRRLGQVEPPRRARDAALGQQHMQHAQQVGIE
jgi:hypothetical protein